MARCGCSGTCNCKFGDSAMATVGGSGTPSDPYLVSPGPTYTRSVAGGIAGLDVDGDVIDAAGIKILGGGGSGGSGIPNDGSVTDIKVSTLAAIQLNKTVDSTGSLGRLAMTNLERSRLAAMHDNATNQVDNDARYAIPMGSWLPNVAYAINQVVTNGTRAWRAASPVPARTTFTPADWEAWAPTPGNPGIVTINAGDPVSGYADGTFIFEYVPISDTGSYVFPQGPAGPTGPQGPPGPSGGGGGGTGSLLATMVSFSQLTGTTDDAKLDAFISTYSAATFKPTLVLDELRTYTFTTQHQLFTGFAMIGGTFRALDQARSSTPMGQKVALRQATAGARGVFTLPNGTIFGIYIAGISFDADAHSRLIEPNSGCVIWTSTFRDISWQNGPNLFGTSGTLQPVDACAWDGYWNVNNVQDCSFNLGGSDCRFQPTLMLLDSPTSLMGPTGCLIRFSSFGKSTVQGIYLTCEQHMGMIIANSQEQLRIMNCDIEGRNAGAPSYGCLVRISNDVTMSHCWTSFAMSNPSAANGGAASNQGIIHITAGNVDLSHMTYRCASGVDGTIPYVYISGGRLLINGITAKDSSGARFTPIVKAATGVTVTADSTVTIVTF
jgi:hypothetical protein